MTNDEMVNEYFDAILEAFVAKARGYFTAGTDTRDRFARLTAIKQGLRGIGTPKTFSIAASDYDRCPSGVCNGTVCTRQLSFGGDPELRKLTEELGFPEDFFFLER